MKVRKIPFDTLAYANRMKAVGMPSQQAEEQAEALAEIFYDGLDAKLDHVFTKEDAKNFLTKEDAKNFATKEDLKNFATKEDLKSYPTKEELRADLKNELKNFATKEELRADVAELKSELIKWMVGLTTGNIAIIASLISLMKLVT